MAAKAAQLAQWLKELQERVNADGNLSYNEIIRFTKEKSLTQKQLDGILIFFMNTTLTSFMMKMKIRENRMRPISAEMTMISPKK